MESQTSRSGTTLSAAGYKCMVRAMLGLPRSARRSLVALLVPLLMLGVNGFVGAIHSAHHLPAPAKALVHQTHDRGQHGHAPAPTSSSQEACPVAAAVLHLAGTGVEALPSLELSPAEAGLVALGLQDSSRAAWKEPACGRAPPSSGSLPS